MTYASRDDMVKAFGESECIALTDRSYTGVIDDDVLNGGLERASARIDTYLASRYPVPWTDTPGVLVGTCCDIARYELTGASTQNTDEIRDRYREAIRFLESVAAGRATLGRLSDGSVAESSNRARFTSGGRQFGRDETGGGAF
ncbi:gp436 family protein [Candidatus Pantoea formicae]|uniref:gp436 family protein n=1 Tax=Candidatus Pantoea formicae TaxID=2608355 RepID=UPI003ED8E23C